ncbi:alkene reductase [Novosphingobium sp. KCTC 2891]|uniref:alkene reductase n=1 Tax=Novosphingobium sp. KCTC 2891 TaxID=2989730 RepID=UPI0022239C18|nr:alkene reductase [Novosphingobium sp. KCTC 2891]MCW1382286.1 alkene reductase [Novosphingobium sp. KCTC 2891]
MHDSLFQPIQLGAITAPNRILMAPCTRTRAQDDGVPSAMMATYYAQRAGAGLIISEAVGISREGLGTARAPGIWTAEQVEGWKPVTDAVHEAGGRIVCQLWHMGRVVHPWFLGGEPPVSASATRLEDGMAHTPAGRFPYEPARPLRIDEMARVVEDYALAARGAREAGFDGVQLHAANGYLIDQFLRSSTNLRDDDYGGPAENRVRLLREVLQGLVAEWDAGHVSVRLSPNGDSQGADDHDPATLFAHAAQVVQDAGAAFLELRQPGPEGSYGSTDVPQQDAVIRKIYKGPLVLNSDYTAEAADADVASGRCDAVSFGRPYLSNPDLAERIRTGAAWAPNRGAPKSWYYPSEEGYTDYPTLAEETAGAAA